MSVLLARLLVRWLIICLNCFFHYFPPILNFATRLGFQANETPQGNLVHRTQLAHTLVMFSVREPGRVCVTTIRPQLLCACTRRKNRAAKTVATKKNNKKASYLANEKLQCVFLPLPPL